MNRIFEIKQYDYLSRLWKNAPLSWAIVRTIECELLASQKYVSPILEVGCGDGFVSQLVFQNIGLHIDLGIDLSEEELRRAQKTGIYKRLECKNICNSGIESSKYNTVFSNGVLEHISDLDIALKEISRLLKRGGRLITTSPTDTYPCLLFYYRLLNHFGFSNLAKTYINYVNNKFNHKHLIGRKDWAKRLEKAGLSLISYKEYLNPVSIAIHDICLPFAFGSKTLKRKTDDMVLFPTIRHLFQKPVIPFVKKLIQDPSENANYGSILLIAKKL